MGNSELPRCSCATQLAEEIPSDAALVRQMRCRPCVAARPLPIKQRYHELTTDSSGPAAALRLDQSARTTSIALFDPVLASSKLKFEVFLATEICAYLVLAARTKYDVRIWKTKRLSSRNRPFRWRQATFVPPTKIKVFNSKPEFASIEAAVAAKKGSKKRHKVAGGVQKMSVAGIEPTKLTGAGGPLGPKSIRQIDSVGDCYTDGYKGL